MTKKHNNNVTVPNNHEDVALDSKQKPTTETKVAIANLVLVAINIILTVGIGIYLQRQIIVWQQDAQLAKIKIDIRDTFLYPITITNNGLSTARNLRVAICIFSANAMWRNAINDINDFDIYINDPSIKYRKESTQNNCERYILARILTPNDTILFTIDTLPPNQKVQIGIDLSSSVPTKVENIAGTAHMLLPSKHNLSEDDIALGVFNILGKNFSLAEFIVTTSCENCTVEPNKALYDFSAPGRWTWQNYAIYESGNNFQKSSLGFALDFRVPQNSQVILSDKQNYSLFLESNAYTTDPQFLFSEIYGPIFMSTKP
jgi:hypothetical protein